MTGGQTNNLICLQSLSPGVHLISSRNDQREINCCRQTELVPFHFPFISHHFAQRENSDRALWLVSRGPVEGILALSLASALETIQTMSVTEWVSDGPGQPPSTRKTCPIWYTAFRCNVISILEELSIHSSTRMFVYAFCFYYFCPNMSSAKVPLDKINKNHSYKWRCVIGFFKTRAFTKIKTILKVFHWLG